MSRVSMPQTNTKLSFAISDFSGGLVNNVNDAKMENKESPDLLNMMFRNDGLLQKRPGSIFIKGFRYDCNKVFVVEPEPNVYKYIFINSGAMYLENGNDTPYHIMNLDRPILDGCQFMNKFFFVDGEYVYYYDLKTKFVYKIVSCPSDFTPIPKPSTYGEVKTKHISGVLFETWYEPCEYELEDGYKGSSVAPIKPSIIITHKDRLYVSGNIDAPNMIYISDILQPVYFPSALPLQTPSTDDVITSLKVFNDCLIIGRRDTIYVLFGNSNRTDSISQYTLTKVNTHTGIINNNCCDLVHNMMFFVGSDGNLYRLSPPSTSMDVLATTQVNRKLDLFSKPFNLHIGDFSFAHTKYDSQNGLWYIQIGNHTIVYNYNLMAFTRYNNIEAIQFITMNSELQFLRRDGNIYRFAKPTEHETYYDNYYDPKTDTFVDIPVRAYWTSRNMDLGNPALVKQFRNMYIVSESFDNHDSVVRVNFEVDYIDVNQEFAIDNEVAKWDVAVWDKHKFTSRNIDRSLPIVLNRRGRTIKVSFGNGYDYFGSFHTFPKPGEVPEYSLIYYIPEGKMYLRTPYREGFDDMKDKYFREFFPVELNQALLVHNVNGLYQKRGYR